MISGASLLVQAAGFAVVAKQLHSLRGDIHALHADLVAQGNELIELQSIANQRLDRLVDIASRSLDVQEKILQFVRAGLAVAMMRGKSYLGMGGVSMGIAGSSPRRASPAAANAAIPCSSTFGMPCGSNISPAVSRTAGHSSRWKARWATSPNGPLSFQRAAR